MRTDVRNPEAQEVIAYDRCMIRRVAVHDLVGAHEIAERLGVARPQVVHDWRRRHDDFPQPIAQLKTALIWDWSEVEAWAQQTGRLQRR